MLNVRLDKELERQLQQYADLSEKTKTLVVKEALTEYLQKHPLQGSAFDKGADLFGVDGAREEDLSLKSKRKLKHKIGQKHTH